MKTYFILLLISLTVIASACGGGGGVSDEEDDSSDSISSSSSSSSDTTCHSRVCGSECAYFDYETCNCRMNWVCGYQILQKEAEKDEELADALDEYKNSESYSQLMVTQ